ncbi:MAG: GTP-binding protein, partial [Ectopseudomonas oleovorans]
MPLEHHPLNREFPQQQAALRKLMQNDAHFVRLAAEYEALDKRTQVRDVAGEAAG